MLIYSFPDAREMMVEVKFPQDNNGAPEIRQHSRPVHQAVCPPDLCELSN
jgi:hypothetical protein